MTTQTTIIPVAGGKGGVGKSLFTANLALALAQSGHPTIAVDLDLGGSNLHSFLGLPNENPGVGDFLLARCADLEELVVPTGFPHLRFLPGDGRNPFMANITHAHKVRLLQAVQRLPARYVLLDLGAGSAYNTLDFFALSPRGMVVTTPDLPAVMNLMIFLKNLALRLIAQEMNGREPFRKILETVRVQPMAAPAITVRDLVAQIAAVDPETAARVEEICAGLCPRLIFNQGDHPEDLEVAQPIERNLADRLSIRTEAFGFIFFDPVVRAAVRSRQPLLVFAPESAAAQGIVRIAERLVRLWEKPLANSRERLLQDTRQCYDRWQAPAAEP